MRIVLFEPDIAGNVGAAIRTAACFGADVEIIGPCGFPLADRDLRRAAMDYASAAPPLVHDSWARFEEFREATGGRLLLLSTRAEVDLWDFKFEDGDRLLLGRESAGVPDFVRDRADASIRIPMAPGVRSLNVAVAGAVALAEAARQARRP